MKQIENAAVIDNIPHGPYFILRLQSPMTAPLLKPGQFVNIRASGSLDPLLRRPVSVYDVSGDAVSLLILIKGKGTTALSRLSAGDHVSLMGPLGNGFPVPEKPPLFIAGGVGAAPFLYFSRGLDRPVMLLGAKSSSMLPPLQDFESVMDVRIATDDGSMGAKGTVLDLLPGLSLPDYTIYACGPTPMFRALNRLFNDCGRVKAWFSLETRMGCGFGACKGCAVEMTDGRYSLCCKDGPVYAYNEVKW